MLITDVPRVFADPTAELNATKKKREDGKDRENTEANFTNPRRNYWMAQERLRDHSPKSKDTKLDSTVTNNLRSKLCFVYSHFFLPTVVRRLVRSTAEVSGSGIRLGRERIDHSVHSSPCALHHTVRDVLSGNRRILRHVPRCADRPSLNAANANPQREKY